MYNQSHQYNEQERHGGNVEYVSLYDPFVYQTLQSVLGRHVVVETSKGSIRGKLADVKPDHVTIQTKEATFFIRTQEIVWVMPS
ncbi:MULTISPECIES: YuzF family protein [Bacillaceae]|uniref:YuzF family protein n=1 Tax=Evansella alkalicola TaxID=745819 RepID=A0ABS6JR49_9BACI|nr:MULTISPECIES: YuzF family protein [Bacillaceae]MBU9721033.1 YuzF family protein [Bacillus alkalicola]